MAKFEKGGCSGWYHEDEDEEVRKIGYYHTYDDFSIPLVGTPPRKVHVFLPRFYESDQIRYPVIYMNDGNTSFWNGPLGKSWRIQRVLAQLLREGLDLRVIIVAIEPRDREHEYTHVKWMPTRTYGGLEEYSNILAYHVKPWFDTHYKTDLRSSKTVIMGSSHGGLAAFFTANRHPQSFGNAACLSSSFWVGLLPSSLLSPLASSNLIKCLQDVLRDTNIRPRLYLDWGSVRSGGPHNLLIEKFAEDRGREMVDLLQKEYGYSNEELKWVEDRDGEHTEESWNKRLPNILRHLQLAST
eukprot:TRINITY_DN11376_c0_g1_i1.p1 TRINITY_DN11376_c0_g1~~TRINITY_DN11376_c0_g1_i1.p1  ORF type:complete len:298 (-),score=49.01 TRINITY_DN11376_c0_g1_i1:68-961(-)